MATSGFKIEHLLSVLDMDRFYPEKLTREDLNEITTLSVAEKETVTQDTICKHFINRLTRYNYQARNLKVETQNISEQHLGFLERKKQEHTRKTTEFHPLDIVIVVFLCCDPVAKQDFVKYLWECKLSVPFVLQLPGTPSIHMFKWPLRSLVAQWQDHTDKVPVEYSISECPMQTVGVLRVGLLDDSKSALLNGIIGGSEKAHPMFFHRDSYGSKRKRSELVHGLIELGWYFPDDSGNDTFCHCTAFANLRGDAVECPEQFNLLVETSNILIILSHTRNLLPACDTLKTAILKAKSSLLILVDKEIGKNEEARIESLLNVIGNKHLECNFEILPLEDKQLAEKLEYININVKIKLETTQKSAHEIFSTEHVAKSRISIDEICDIAVAKGIYNANKIIDKIITIKDIDKKSVFLPFQGENWKRWTEIENEMHRLQKFSENNVQQDILSYRNELEVQKHQLRKIQFLLKDNISPIMKTFLSNIGTLKGKQFSVYLRALKLGLDDLSRKFLRPYYRKYQEILCQKMGSNKDENDILNKKLERLDKEKHLLSVGLEHFTRELGQMFEACADQNNTKIHIDTSTYNMPYHHLPYLAADILLNGYPVEIMDGDVGFVPVNWVQHVLAALKIRISQNEKRTFSPRLHVISVLGIQSSGKSTLLNSLFGLQFAVSAGRCTKGVFMQMVKVNDDLRTRLQFEYILVIDTEGLRSAQLSSPNSIKFDNELSCFAIGLADTTVVNLMGENATYLEENLPIVVHAFLRMDMIGLRPHCMIVHHNVDKRNKQKLMEQGRLLEKVLNDLTAKLCDFERISPPKRFKDIIDFDIEYHTDYIPALLEGEQPMGCRSIGYSQECNNFRRKLIAHSEQNSRHMDLNQCSRHLSALWKAMQNDQFVFEFRSTLETEARRHLDDFFRNIYKSLVDSVSDIGEKATNELLSSPMLVSRFPDMKQRTTKRIEAEGERFYTDLLTYLEDPSNVHQRILHRWKDGTLANFRSKLYEVKTDCINQLQQRFDKEMSCSKHALVKQFEKEDKKHLRLLILQEISKTKCSERSIEQVWLKWFEISFKKSQGLVSCDQQKKNAIQRDVEKFLREILESDKHLIEKSIDGEDVFAHKSLDDFVVEKKHISGSVLTFYWNKSKVESLTAKVKSTVKNETKTVLSEKIPYSATKVRQIIFMAMRYIEPKEKYYTQVYKVDIALAIGRHVVKVFQLKNEEETRKEEIKFRQMHRYLYIPYIREYMFGTNELLVENCATIIIEKFLDSAIKQTMKYIHQLDLYSQEFPSLAKTDIINYLLYQAVSAHELDAIDAYIKNPKEAAISILSRQIQSSDIQQMVVKMVSQRIFTFLGHLDRQIAESPASLAAVLLKTFKMCFLNLSEADLKAFSSLNVNTKKVLGTIASKIRALDSSQWAPRVVHEIECKIGSIKYTTAEYFISKHFGCFATCPFCEEVCMFSDRDHDGPHETSMHRPIACQGYHNLETNELSIETCSNQVASKAMVKIESTLVSFKDYSKHFPEWKIHGDISLDVSMLWKWYFSHYPNRIKKGNLTLFIPSAWELVTEERVRHSLLNGQHIHISKP